MFGLQPTHILIIVVVLVLLFGASRLPEIGRGFGKSIAEFKKGAKEIPEEFNKGIKDDGASGTTMIPNADGSAVSFCINCGAKNPAEAKFCNKCGAALVVAKE